MTYLPECKTCQRTKKPLGRNAPLGGEYCSHECPGYQEEPFPPCFWSREEELETRCDELREDFERLVATEAAVMAERDALKARYKRLVEQVGAIIEKENT